ncbi:MAG: phosphatidylserine decarboxylase, partial [Candidatus Altiarchaeota archaeon]
MKKPSIVKEGKVYATLSALFATLSYNYNQLVGFLFVSFAGFILYFFRDPERTIPGGVNLVLAPADGRVTKVEDFTDSFIGGKGKVVSIFLSPFDVHINRSPIKGRIDFMEYTKGRKYPAYLKRASSRNESNLIGIIGGDINVMVKQIAGVFARRIATWVHEGDSIGMGQKLGMIRFGSRTEIYVPDTVEICVSPGQKVKAGESII